jgi:hypothetical protein
MVNGGRPPVSPHGDVERPGSWHTRRIDSTRPGCFALAGGPPPRSGRPPGLLPRQTTPADRHRSAFKPPASPIATRLIATR